MHILYDIDGDTLYVQLLAEEDAAPDHGEPIDTWRSVDFSEAGRVFGVEFLRIHTHPINLDGVPEAETIRRLIDDAADAVKIPA